MPSMLEARKQVVTGVVPPQLAEAVIRRAWPSVAAFPGVAGLGSALMRSIIGAPLGWLLLLPFYFLKVLPLFARRYTLTNRRLMIQRGLSAQAAESVNLAEIDEVRITEDRNTSFYRAATLEIMSQGKVALTLPGVVGYQAFRHAVLNAIKAWVPGKASSGEFIPASAMKKG